MKKIITICVILIYTNTIYSQIVNYGILIGINSNDVETEGTNQIFGADAPGLDGYLLGGFIDYQLNNNFGIKGDLIYNTVKEGYRIVDVKNIDFKVNTLQLNTHLKYDVNGEYNKGFYLVAGPRFSFLLSAKNENNEDIDDFYKKTNFGAHLGFGIEFLEYLDIEILGDYGFTNSVNPDNLKTKIFNFRVSLNINLFKLFNH